MTIWGKHIRLLRRTKRNLFICISIIAFGLFTLLWSQTLDPFRQHDFTSCHNLRDNNSLPTLERHLNLPPRSIFFHATSCPGNLTSRQHCAIESAARTHREWQINVVFSGPTFLKNSHLKNVKLWRIYIKEFSKGTPFEEYIDKGVLKKCGWNAELATNVLKFLSLATWGGIYLDLDIVVVRPLGSLARNWATRDDEGVIGDSVLALSRDSFGKNVSEIAVKEIVSILNKKGDCGTKGPPVITRALKSYCSTADPAYMSSATCNGIEVYGPQFFHPIPKSRAREYFKPQELGTNNAYTYHLWDRVTKEYQVTRTSPLSKIARQHCPLTFKSYPDQFGFSNKDNKDFSNNNK